MCNYYLLWFAIMTLKYFFAYYDAKILFVAYYDTKIFFYKISLTATTQREKLQI